MDTIPLSKFKATCSAMLASISDSVGELMITRYGKPIALVRSVAMVQAPVSDWLGSLAGTIEIKATSLDPSIDPERVGGNLDD